VPASTTATTFMSGYVRPNFDLMAPAKLGFSSSAIYGSPLNFRA
jgi:hypothetical protein